MSMQLIEVAKDLGQIAVRNAKDLFSSISQSPGANNTTGSQLFRGSTQTSPKRATREYLQAYSTMPWLRAVTSKVSWSVASTEWKLFAVRSKKDGSFIEQKSVRGMYQDDRRRKLKALKKQGVLVEIEDNPLLDLLQAPNNRLTGVAAWQLTQSYMDLVGEAAWIMQPSQVLPIPEALWQIPPHWVRALPTSTHPFFRIQLEDMSGTKQPEVDIPAEMVVWFTNPNPLNPYARGTGTAEALGDELETDEFTAKYIKAWFYNRAMPDILISGKGLNKEMNKRLETDWLKKNQGFWKAFKPYFLQGEDIKVDVLQQNFKNLEVHKLRTFERDTILQVYGVPPEIFGILAASNRATIEAADFLYARWVLVPRLELLRATLQQQLVPLFDERLILDYESPVEEDKEHSLKVMTAAPWAFPMGEWREAGGQEMFGDDRDALHKVGISDEFRTFNPAELAKLEDDIINPPEPVVEPAADNDADDDSDDDKHAFDPHVKDTEEELDAWHLAHDEAPEPEAHKAVGNNTRAFIELHRIARRMEPEFREAFRRSVVALGRSVEAQHLLDALRAQNAEAALGLFTDEKFTAAFAKRHKAAIRKTFTAGGNLARDLLTGDAVGAAFDLTNPKAVEFIDVRTATLVTEVTESTKAGIRTIVERGFVEGRTSDKIARDIREYGVGVTSRQAKAVDNFRKRLEAAGVNPATIEKRTAKFAEAQVRFRAKMIARTETINAANGGQIETWRQSKAKGFLPGVTMKQWLVTGDDRLDAAVCEPMDGQQVGLEDPFETGTGSQVNHPTAHPLCRCSMRLVIPK